MRRFFRASALFLLAATTAACGSGAGKGPLPPEIAAEVAYRDPGPPRLTLISAINNRTGSGAHTALMVSSTQRVIFDPAGPYRVESFVEQGDVLYGITPRLLEAYKAAHARAAYRVVLQEIDVPPEVAAQALALVEAQGTVGPAFCANSTATILRQLPGFEDIQVTFQPHNLMEQFGSRPGVETSVRYENDAGDILDAPPP